MKNKSKPIVTHLAHGFHNFGGPPGYLSRLREAFRLHPSQDFEVRFHDCFLDSRKDAFIDRVVLAFTRRLKKLLPDSRLKHEFQWYESLVNHIANYHPVDLEKIKDSSIVCCHIPFLIRGLSLKKERNFSLVSMNHSPTLLVEEFATDQLQEGGAEFCRKIHYLRKQRNREIASYLNSDFVLMPSENAWSSYPKDLTSRIRQGSRFVYARTGTWPARVSDQPKDFRKSLKLPKDSKLILFVGRYHYDKGFDLFQKAAIELKEEARAQNVWFVCAGKPMGLFPEDPIIDIGSVDPIGDLLSQVDLVICANRKTYFDLLPLEVLSVGTPIAISKVGGNLDLLKLLPDVLSFEPNEASLVSVLRRFLSQGSDIPSSLKLKSAFDEHFSLQEFARNHEAAYRKILG